MPVVPFFFIDKILYTVSIKIFLLISSDTV